MYRYHHEICSIITFFMFSLRGYLIHNKNIQLNIKLAHPQSKTFTALKSYRILLITCLKWPHQRTLSLTYNGGHALCFQQFPQILDQIAWYSIKILNILKSVILQQKISLHQLKTPHLYYQREGGVSDWINIVFIYI